MKFGAFVPEQLDLLPAPFLCDYFSWVLYILEETSAGDSN